MRVERTRRGAGGEQRTVETWSAGEEVGDGSHYAQTADGHAQRIHLQLRHPERGGRGRARRARDGPRRSPASHEAICYVVEATEYNAPYALPGRTCIVPRIGIVSDDRDGAMTLTSYTLR